MYLRRVERRDDDGRTTGHVQLVDNRWGEGGTRADVLVDLGPEEGLDLQVLRQLTASVSSYVDERDGTPVDGAQVRGAGRDAARWRERMARGRAGDGLTGPPTPAGAPSAGLDVFIGRERELTELRQFLARSPLVTIIGPGGVGKSRLTSEFLHNRLSPRRYPAGVWWIELAPLPPASPITYAVAEVVGASARPGTSIEEAIARNCAAGAGLLVLDNCEHVAEECAHLLGWLLQRCPDLTVLATSREALRIAGEQLLPLATLAVPGPRSSPPHGHVPGESPTSAQQIRAVDSVRLFVERARAVSPGFALTDESAAAVARICAGLDGLPLAIELAARQVAVLPPDRLASALDGDAAPLVGADRGRPERHQSLRAAFDWSYGLLGDDERLVFCRLSALPGGFDLDTAAALCGDVLDERALPALLLALSNKSLVVPEPSAPGSGRFRILGPLRAIGRDYLRGAGELVEVHQRLIAWLAGIAETVFTDVDAIDRINGRLMQEEHNLRYAVRIAQAELDSRLPWLALALTRVLQLEGDLTAARSLIETVQPAAGPGAAETVVDGLARIGLASVLRDAGELRRAEHEAEQALKVAQRLGDQALTVTALKALSLALMTLGEFATATTLESQLLEILRALGATRAMADSLNILAWTSLLEGRLEEADLAASEALLKLPSDSAPNVYVATAHTAATVALLRGRLDQARAYYSIGLLTASADVQFIPYNLEGLALVAAREGDPERAVRLLHAAEAERGHSQAQRDPWWSALCDETLAAARNELVEADATAAAEAGRELTAAQATAYALGGPRPSPTTSPSGGHLSRDPGP